MPTHHPRINVVLEEPLYHLVSKVAKREGVSLSMKARDLIKEAMELEEDVYWGLKAETRAKTFPKKGLTHKEVWKKVS